MKRKVNKDKIKGWSILILLALFILLVIYLLGGASAIISIIVGIFILAFGVAVSSILVIIVNHAIQLINKK